MKLNVFLPIGRNGRLLDLLDRGKIKKGNTIDASICLIGGPIYKVNRKEKLLLQLDYSPHTPEYLILGKFIKTYKRKIRSGETIKITVLDCGFPLVVLSGNRIYDETIIKKGDYLLAIGRLDLRNPR